MYQSTHFIPMTGCDVTEVGLFIASKRGMSPPFCQNNIRITNSTGLRELRRFPILPATKLNRRSLIKGSLAAGATIAAGSPTAVASPEETTRQREKLDAARMYFVRPDGSDSNNGLTNDTTGAFQTIQRAVDRVLTGVDFAGQPVTIQVADGTYTAPVEINGPQVGSGPLRIIGNRENPENVVIATTDVDCIAAKQIAVEVAGMELRTEVTGNCLHVAEYSHVTFGNIRFGPCARTHINGHRYGVCVCTRDYAITGPAQFHYHAKEGSGMFIDAGLVTIETPFFGKKHFFNGAFAAAENLGLLFVRTHFSGSANGIRYRVRGNAVLDADGKGEDFFPGTKDGILETGGIYI